MIIGIPTQIIQTTLQEKIDKKRKLIMEQKPGDKTGQL